MAISVLAIGVLLLIGLLAVVLTIGTGRRGRDE
jgi:hypothetical protein